MRRTDNTGTSMILTSATLVRSLNGDNNMITDVTVIAACFSQSLPNM